MPENKSTNSSQKLLDQVRGKMRFKHYSICTDQAYVDWIKRFICHFDKRRPNYRVAEPGRSEAGFEGKECCARCATRECSGAGAARRQVTFLASPRKANQKKATPPHRPFGLPSVFRKDRAAAELALCAQTVLADGPRSFRKTEAVQRGIWVLWAEPVFWVPSPRGGLGGEVWFCCSVPLVRRRAAQPGRGISARTV